MPFLQFHSYVEDIYHDNTKKSTYQLFRKSDHHQFMNFTGKWWFILELKFKKINNRQALLGSFLNAFNIIPGRIPKTF